MRSASQRAVGSYKGVRLDGVADIVKSLGEQTTYLNAALLHRPKW